MDVLSKALCPKHKLALVLTDVTESVRAMERTHLSGPTAGRLLGEAVTATALLSANLGHPQERLSLQMQVEGPVGGVLVDADFNGDLRGFTHVKILNEVDGDPDTPLSAILGEKGFFGVIQSTPQGVQQSGQIRAEPPELRANLAMYCNQSLQRKTAVELVVQSRDAAIERARGLTVEKMPDGDTEAFVDVLKRLEAGSIRELFATAESVDLAQIGKELGLDNLVMGDNRDLRFACHCSAEKTLEMAKTLPEDELRDIIAKEEDPEITCHFCGKDYRIPMKAIAEILRERRNA